MKSLRVVKGQPDDDELAAVVAAIALVVKRSQAQAAASSAEISRWRKALWQRQPEVRRGR